MHAERPHHLSASRSFATGIFLPSGWMSANLPGHHVVPKSDGRHGAVTRAGLTCLHFLINRVRCSISDVPILRLRAEPMCYTS